MLRFVTRTARCCAWASRWRRGVPRRRGLRLLRVSSWPGGRLNVRLISADEFIELEAAKMDWVIHTLIARPSKVTLIGAPKEGKSFLSVGLADAVARGVQVAAVGP